MSFDQNGTIETEYRTGTRSRRASGGVALYYRDALSNESTILEGTMTLNTCWDETEVKDIASHLQDGRLVELSTSFLKMLKQCSELADKGGGFGKIYISRDSIPGFKHRLVLKEIGGDDRNNKSHTQLLSSVKNEKLASRVRHFAIVPLLAYHDDISIGKYYLISPYFENQDLFDAIRSDTGKQILLVWKTRLKAIYQIACAIDYMHTPNSFRGTILHLDIKSKNIVLDKMYNARLIDFGLSRESKAGGNITTGLFSGTVLYRPQGCYKPSPLLDYYAFGVVIREILTGLGPDGAGHEEAGATQTPLGLLDKRNFELLILRRIWNVDVWENLSNIADRCISGFHDKSKQITSASMLSLLKSILIKEGQKEWTVLGDNKCEICVVNEQLEKKNSFIGPVTGKYHSSYCTTKIKTCCACMRNGYINPVKCHGCDKDDEIKAIIGDGWGAILIAGYDEDNSFFQKDVKVFAHAISSKVLPSMCVSTLIVIDPASNTERPVSARIYDAFEEMVKRDIHTLVFLYSGHHGKTGFQVGFNEYVGIQLINDMIQNCTNIKKVIGFMDCCQPDEIKVNAEQKLIQFNATSSADEVIWNKGKHSYFTKVLVQAFTMKASGGKCEFSGCECNIDGDFITIDKLKNYIEIHRQNGLLPHDPQWFVSKIDWMNEYLAYNYTYKVAFRFEIVLPQPFTAKQAHEVLATTVVDYQGLIQRILFPKFANLLGEQLKTQEKSITHTNNDVDFLCIVYETGPKSCEEVDNIEQLLLAWNSKRLLFCKLRFSQTSNFHKPFGFYLENGKSVQDCIYENGKSVKDYVYEKNEFEMKEMENILQELQDKQKKFDTPKDALTNFILNVSSFIDWWRKTKLKHRKLQIRFIDLFEECSSCVVHLSLIAPAAEIQAELEKEETKSVEDVAHIRNRKRNYMGMLEYKKEEETAVVTALILELTPKVASCLLPGLPAYLLFMCVRHTDFINDDEKVRSFLTSTRNGIKTVVENYHDDVERVTLWLANACRFLHTLKQYSGEKQFQTENTPRQNKHCLRNLNLSEYRMVFSDLSEWIYQTLIKQMKATIQPSIVPAVLEHEAIAGFSCRSSSRAEDTPEYSLDSPIKYMNLFLGVLTQHEVDPELIKQIFRQVYYFLGATALNNLLLRRDLCNCFKGMQIRYNLSHMELWLRENKLEESGADSSLEPIIQASLLLQARKTDADVDSVCEMCSKLTVPQIVTILNLYTPVDEFEERVPISFIRKIQQKLKERESTDTSLLMDLNFSYSVTFPFNPSSIALETIEVPQQLNLAKLVVRC